MKFTSNETAKDWSDLFESGLCPFCQSNEHSTILTDKGWWEYFIYCDKCGKVYSYVYGNRKQGEIDFFSEVDLDYIEHQVIGNKYEDMYVKTQEELNKFKEFINERRNKRQSEDSRSEGDIFK